MPIDRGKASQVIVFLEPPDGKGEELNRGLLTEGGRVAGFLGGRLCALTVGKAIEGTAMLGEYGVFTLYRVDTAGVSEYSAEAFSWAAAFALRDTAFRLLLFAHSDRGSDLAPRIAAGLNTAAVMDCVDIRLTKEGLSYVRHVYGGQFEQEVSYQGCASEIATIRPEVLSAEKKTLTTNPQVVTLSVAVPRDLARTVPLELIPPDPHTIDVLYAKRLVGVGSGCGHLAHLSEELAELLDASIGTTRPVVDDGIIPKARMIGQTGKTVSPDFYLALGISGSPHHAAGIQKSKKILAINKDPRAPIFDLADTGFVGDLNGVLPKLIARIRRYKDTGR
jgi:electron transfer flavoprotein alpha subunit